MTNLNGYLVPKMAMKETHRPPVGRIGLQREKFLQENHSLLYDKMLLDGTLYSDLKQTEQRYWEQVEQTITKPLVSNPAPDKNNDPLGWTAHMNSLQAQAAELAIERIYICRMSQISGEERHLISFFRRLMRYKVNVIATEYALNLKVPAYHMGAIIDEICARKGWERPWFVSESEERHCVSNAVASTSFGTPNDNLLGETP